MIDEHDTARVFDNVLLATKMEIYPDKLCYYHHTSGRHSEKFYFIYILIKFENLTSLANPYRELTAHFSNYGFEIAWMVSIIPQIMRFLLRRRWILLDTSRSRLRHIALQKEIIAWWRSSSKCCIIIWNRRD